MSTCTTCDDRGWLRDVNRTGTRRGLAFGPKVLCPKNCAATKTTKNVVYKFVNLEDCSPIFRVTEPSEDGTFKVFLIDSAQNLRDFVPLREARKFLDAETTGARVWDVATSVAIGKRENPDFPAECWIFQDEANRSRVVLALRRLLDYTQGPDRKIT